MLRRSLFACALMLASVVGFASSAKAAEQPVEFMGTIDATCNLTAPATGDVSGTLVANTDKTAFSTGTPARIGINCSGGTLTVSDPMPDPSNPTPTTTNMATIITAGGKTVVSDSGTGDKTADLEDEDTGNAVLSMDASVATGTTLDDGDYLYTVTVTATPE